MSSNTSANIVITGQGIISAIGIGVQENLQALRDGRSGIGMMRYLNSSHHELPVGEVDRSNDQLKAMLGIASEREVNRTALLGMVALRQAIDEAGLWRHQHHRIVLVDGTTVGGMDLTERYFGSFCDSDEHIECMRQHDCGATTELMADYFGFFDESTTLSTACSAAANALIVGANLLRSGQADFVVAGGAEALSRYHLNGFNSLMILDHEVCRPFDDTRAGLNLGEGAAFVVMERELDARERGASILGYLTGYGNACDAFHQTMSSPDGEGAYRAMTQALAMAGLQPDEIDYINAHGTGTVNNDQSESAALRRVFGDQMPPVTSTKMYTGHTTSASGAIEAVFSLLALRHCFVPANLGWSHASPDVITPSMGISPLTINQVLCNSFGFGGNDTSLVFSRRPKHNLDHLGTIRKVRIAAQVELADPDSLADINKYIKPMEARRMGKLLKASLLTSFKALETAGIDAPDAIITATAWGCAEHNELLLDQLEREGEVPLKPTYFMQSTHNTISSNIAIHLHCHGYNVTYCHGMQSFDWALRDAKMLLQGGMCRTVLVGLHEEVTPLMRSLLGRLGLPLASANLYSKAVVMTINEE